ncbi:MAG TPA: tyrosine-type recombinase/integrase, partial [Candidatus Entotheonella sp.]
IVPIDWSVLRFPIVPKFHLDAIRPLLPAKNAPIRPNGKGYQGCYLAEISDALGELLASFIFASLAPRLSKLTDPRTFNVYFNRILKSARLPPIRLHDARHTYATLLLEEGVQAKVVQEILGYGSIAMTLDIYSHVSMDLKREAAAKLNVVFTDKFR